MNIGRLERHDVNVVVVVVVVAVAVAVDRKLRIMVPPLVCICVCVCAFLSLSSQREPLNVEFGGRCLGLILKEATVRYYRL